MSIYYIDDYELVQDEGRKLTAIRLNECGRKERRAFCFRSCEATVLKHLRDLGATEGSDILIHGEDTEEAITNLAQLLRAAGFVPLLGTEQHPLTLYSVSLEN